jgi:protein-S-isoprenylcysteine O-methyltransferase Ste14
VLLAVQVKFALYVGTALSLLVISAPLAFVGIQLDELLSRPVTWAYYSLIGTFCFLEARLSLYLPNENPTKVEKVFLPYLTGICVLIICWVSLYDYANYFQFHLVQAAVGCLLVVSGVAARLASIQKLDKYFISHIALVDNHQLVATGIYAIVRHPSELGLLSICVGVATLLASTTALWIAALVLFPLTIYRVALEDKLLRSLFGSDFDNYKASTPSLLPKFSTTYTKRSIS